MTYSSTKFEVNTFNALGGNNLSQNANISFPCVPNATYLKTYAAIFYAHLSRSANGDSCLGPVFRPLTDSDQHSFLIFLCHIGAPTFY